MTGKFSGEGEWHYENKDENRSKRRSTRLRFIWLVSHFPFSCRKRENKTSESIRAKPKIAITKSRNDKKDEWQKTDRNVTFWFSHVKRVKTKKRMTIKTKSNQKSKWNNDKNLEWQGQMTRRANDKMFKTDQHIVLLNNVSFD